jgi:hypothetical protein
LGQKVNPEYENIVSITYPGLTQQIFALKDVDVYGYLSVIQELIDAHEQLDPLHFH